MSKKLARGGAPSDVTRVSRPREERKGPNPDDLARMARLRSQRSRNAGKMATFATGLQKSTQGHLGNIAEREATRAKRAAAKARALRKP